MQATLNLMLALYHPTMLFLCYCKYCILLGLSLNWSPLNTCVIGEIDHFDTNIFPNHCQLARPRRKLVADFFVTLSDELCMI